MRDFPHRGKWLLIDFSSLEELNRTKDVMGIDFFKGSQIWSPRKFSIAGWGGGWFEVHKNWSQQKIPDSSGWGWCTFRCTLWTSALWKFYCCPTNVFVPYFQDMFPPSPQFSPTQSVLCTTDEIITTFNNFTSLFKLWQKLSWVTCVTFLYHWYVTESAFRIETAVLSAM